MKQISVGQKFVAMAGVFSLLAATFTSPSPAASTAPPQRLQLSALEKTAFPNMGKYQLAQVADSCRQVAPKSGLYVRQEPTVYSTAVGIVASGRYVSRHLLPQATAAKLQPTVVFMSGESH